MNLINGAEDTIVALATPQGVGAIAVIRLSGKEAISIANKVFKGKNLEEQDSHTLHFGSIIDGEEVIDEVLASIFIAPNSFTKENAVELSTHGSPYVAKQVIELLVKNGARLAKAGEFTKRAFTHGRFDLAQAEAVADLIASENEASHKVALNQMRGGFSRDIKKLREKLIHFASMIELELDFSEEDVEFADRTDIRDLIEELRTVISDLMKSFRMGNVIKNGVPTVIAGKPNAGKSTLLNALLNEEKAIVSDIAGTTRDFIEDVIVIDGISFRFIDTAGSTRVRRRRTRGGRPRPRSAGTRRVRHRGATTRPARRRAAPHAFRPRRSGPRGHAGRDARRSSASVDRRRASAGRVPAGSATRDSRRRSRACRRRARSACRGSGHVSLRGSAPAGRRRRGCASAGRGPRVRRRSGGRPRASPSRRHRL